MRDKTRRREDEWKRTLTLTLTLAHIMWVGRRKRRFLAFQRGGGDRGGRLGLGLGIRVGVGVGVRVRG